MKLLVKNIHTLAGVEYEPKLRLKGKEMAQTNTISNAWLLADCLLYTSDAADDSWFV